MSRSNKRKPLNFARAFGKTSKDFAVNSTLHGFQYLIPRCDRTLLERCIWSIIQIIVIYGAVSFILFSWSQFLDDPTVTTLESSYYPIKKIPFPGVSICNINKISRKRAVSYAENLSRKINVSEEKLLEYVKFFGNLYDFASGASEEALFEFQTILDVHDVDPETGAFNPYMTLRELTQPCLQLISNCSWNNVKYKCEDLFIYEATMEGFCCIFNYHPPGRESKASVILEENNLEVLKAKRAGIKGGLTVFIHPENHDYFYPVVSSEGGNLKTKYTGCPAGRVQAWVHIFDSNDFPDTSSGSLQERMVAIGIEMFIGISATVIYSEPEVKHYSVNKRNCRFREEAQTLFGDGYSFSDCLLDCRMKSVLALCGCIPFNFIKALYGPPLPQCTVVDIPCLDRYKGKWRRLYPVDYTGEEMGLDQQDSINCKDCKPSCSNTVYTVKSDFAYLTRPSSNTSLDYSVVNVFFETEKAELYKQDVVYYWFEIVSSFGGTCSLMMGVSLISILECLYFFTFRFYYHLYVNPAEE